MKWIDAFPWPALILVAILFALMPLGSTPHLVEKVRMLLAGTLRRPLDWFDLFIHSVLLLVVVAKVVRQYVLRGGN